MIKKVGDVKKATSGSAGVAKGMGETPKITEIKEKILGSTLLKGKMEGKNCAKRALYY